jgi:hypothetical protein
MIACWLIWALIGPILTAKLESVSGWHNSTGIFSEYIAALRRNRLDLGLDLAGN